MRTEKASLHIIPRDGVRRRLHLRTPGQQIDFELTGGGSQKRNRSSGLSISRGSSSGLKRNSSGGGLTEIETRSTLCYKCRLS
jgi:hypothetical protein